MVSYSSTHRIVNNSRIQIIKVFYLSLFDLFPQALLHSKCSLSPFFQTIYVLVTRGCWIFPSFGGKDQAPAIFSFIKFTIVFAKFKILFTVMLYLYIFNEMLTHHHHHHLYYSLDRLSVARGQKPCGIANVLLPSNCFLICGCYLHIDF